MAAWGDCWDRLVTLLSQQPGAPGGPELIVGLVMCSQEAADPEPDTGPSSEVPARTSPPPFSPASQAEGRHP